MTSNQGIKRSRLESPGPKFNMEPENDDVQKKSPFPGVDFQVNHVNLPRCIVASRLNSS